MHKNSQKTAAMRGALFVLTFLLVFLAVPTHTSVATARDLGISSASAIVICFETGEELFGHNPDVCRAPASMTKMIVAYLVLDAIDKGEFTLESRVPINQTAVNLSNNTGFTNVRLSASGHYTVDELLDAIIVVSASGASYVYRKRQAVCSR